MGKRVVVLDDDQRVVELMTLVLQRDGHDVAGVTSFEQAVALLSNEPAFLLVSDLNMPGVGGIAGIRALKRRNLIDRALVVSGYIDAEIEETIEATPEIVGFMEKPFDIHELAKVVRDILEDNGDQNSLSSE